MRTNCFVMDTDYWNFHGMFGVANEDAFSIVFNFYVIYRSYTGFLKKHSNKLFEFIIDGNCWKVICNCAIRFLIDPNFSILCSIYNYIDNIQDFRKNSSMFPNIDGRNLVFECVLNFPNITSLLTNHWNFVLLFWMFWKVFQNLCLTYYSSFLLFCKN